MTIATLDDLIAAPKQFIPFCRTASRTSVAFMPTSLIDLAGQPGAGTLAGTSTTTGTVPTDATAGFPTINAFGGGASGYIAALTPMSSAIARLRLYDCLWKAGAYAFNASTSGQTPTSYSSRVPGGTDYSGLEIWLEQVTAGTGVQNVNVTYTNEAGTTGHSTGTIATATNIVGRMHRLPLQAGDSGVQGVTGVVGSTASAGTFNILVLRPLWTGRHGAAYTGENQDLFRMGMPEIFADSALFAVSQPDSTSTGLVELFMCIANG